jgi:hypothetical protein
VLRDTILLTSVEPVAVPAPQPVPVEVAELSAVDVLFLLSVPS